VWSEPSLASSKLWKAPVTLLPLLVVTLSPPVAVSATVACVWSADDSCREPSVWTVRTRPNAPVTELPVLLATWVVTDAASEDPPWVTVVASRSTAVFVQFSTRREVRSVRSSEVNVPVIELPEFRDDETSEAWAVPLVVRLVAWVTPWASRVGTSSDVVSLRSLTLVAWVVMSKAPVTVLPLLLADVSPRTVVADTTVSVWLVVVSWRVESEPPVWVRLKLPVTELPDRVWDVPWRSEVTRAWTVRVWLVIVSSAAELSWELSERV